MYELKTGGSLSAWCSSLWTNSKIW